MKGFITLLAGLTALGFVATAPATPLSSIEVTKGCVGSRCDYFAARGYEFEFSLARDFSASAEAAGFVDDVTLFDLEIGESRIFSDLRQDTIFTLIEPTLPNPDFSLDLVSFFGLGTGLDLQEDVFINGVRAGVRFSIDDNRPGRSDITFFNKVPEPATTALLALGLLAAVHVRRRTVHWAESNVR